MKEKVTSTAYVPLQPPYQIISYEGTMGMQIGTLIVTTQTDDSEVYSIKTHSHPVVAYSNKDAKYKTAYPYMEGTVWDMVELRDVSTFCFTDEKAVSWSYFCRFISDDYKSVYSKKIISEPQLQFYWRLRALGITVNRPDAGEYIIHLNAFQPLGPNSTPVIGSAPEDIFPLNISAQEERLMWKMFEAQLLKYSMILRNGSKPSGFVKIKFVSDNPKMERIIEGLNKKPEFTKMILFVDGQV